MSKFKYIFTFFWLGLINFTNIILYFILSNFRLLGQVLAEPSDISSAPEKITVLQKLAANPQIRNELISEVREKAVEYITQLGPASITGLIGSLSAYVGTPTELADVSVPY
jgi:hypothetical protein